MFGAVGLYSGELFFGLIDDDTLFFKSDSTNSAEYIARKMPRFMPFPDRPEAVHGLLPGARRHHRGCGVAGRVGAQVRGRGAELASGESKAGAPDACPKEKEG